MEHGEQLDSLDNRLDDITEQLKKKQLNALLSIERYYEWLEAKHRAEPFYNIDGKGKTLSMETR